MKFVAILSGCTTFLCYALRDTITRTRSGTWARRRVKCSGGIIVNVGHELRIFIVAVIYAFAGMALLLTGYKIFDWLTPTDLQKKIFEDGNVAVAVAVGFFMLGVAVVIHGAFNT